MVPRVSCYLEMVPILDNCNNLEIRYLCKAVSFNSLLYNGRNLIRVTVKGLKWHHHFRHYCRKKVTVSSVYRLKFILGVSALIIQSITYLYQSSPYLHTGFSDKQAQYAIGDTYDAADW